MEHTTARLFKGLTTGEIYEEGYAAGRSGITMDDALDYGDAFAEGYDDGWADYTTEVYGDNADMIGNSMVTI